MRKNKFLENSKLQKVIFVQFGVFDKEIFISSIFIAFNNSGKYKKQFFIIINVIVKKYELNK